MRTLPAPELGQDILIVMDSNPDYLEMLRVAIPRLHKGSQTLFTLLHCCPAIYWEHSGDADTAKREAGDVWKAEQSQLERAKQCCEEVKAILHDAGIPDSHIRAIRAMGEEKLVDATVAELRRGCYTGVIVASYHTDIVDRLLGRGLTDLFRTLPKVKVWALDEAILNLKPV